MFPCISNMANIWRTRYDQYQALIEPLGAWLRAQGVNFEFDRFAADIGLAPVDGITVDRIACDRAGVAVAVAVAPDDLALPTFGSQVADMAVGSMSAAPRPRTDGSARELWRRLARGRPEFGKP
jgi:oleate hydratase